MSGLGADPGDLTRAPEQPAHGHDGDLLANPDCFVRAVALIRVQPGALLGALVEVQQQTRGLFPVAVDELAFADRGPDENDDPVLQPFVIRPELVEFGALIVGDALDLGRTRVVSPAAVASREGRWPRRRTARPARLFG